MCGGEDPIYESKQISSPPQEIGVTDHSKEFKHSSSPSDVCWGEDFMDESEQTSSPLKNLWEQITAKK